MKLAACYSVFNGLELLEKSILQILPYVDVVIISYQTVSNLGNPDYNVLPFVLKFEGEKFKTLCFVPDLDKNTKANEIEKHNAMLQYAKELGCTHAFMSATDHFYNSNQFINAKAEVKEMDYDITFTSMFTYYKKPTWCIDPIEEYMMPFIIKLHPITTIIKKPVGYPAHTDPSVCINTFAKHKIFSPAEIMMHHYSMLRVDIHSKFNNAAASIRWQPSDKIKFINEYENYDIKNNPGVAYFSGRKIKVVPDYFGIGDLEGVVAH